jgi:hypothetical protein
MNGSNEPRPHEGVSIDLIHLVIGLVVVAGSLGAIRFGSEELGFVGASLLLVLWPIAVLAPEVWAGRASPTTYKRLGPRAAVLATFASGTYILSSPTLGVGRWMIPLTTLAFLWTAAFYRAPWRNVGRLYSATVGAFAFASYAAITPRPSPNVALALAVAGALSAFNLERVCCVLRLERAGTAVT